MWSSFIHTFPDYGAHQKCFTQQFRSDLIHQTANMSISAHDHIQQSATVNSDSCHYRGATGPEAKERRWISIEFNIFFSSCITASLALKRNSLSFRARLFYVLPYLPFLNAQSHPVTWGPAAKCKNTLTDSVLLWIFKAKSSFCNRCAKLEHDLTWAGGWQSSFPSLFGGLERESLVPTNPSDRECIVWSRLAFLTLVKELFLACHSEKDKSPAQIPN